MLLSILFADLKMRKLGLMPSPPPPPQPGKPQHPRHPPRQDGP